jgi:transcriptional regulator with XRE-family HTH domain
LTRDAAPSDPARNAARGAASHGTPSGGAPGRGPGSPSAAGHSPADSSAANSSAAGNRAASNKAAGNRAVGSGAADPVRHFGRQVKKARLARGWTLREAGRQLGYDDAQVSRVETGARPPTEGFARACDRVWPERDGWFLDYYTESREWLATPPWFRPWLPIEAAATDLRVWQNEVVPGLLQTEDYAREIMSLEPGLTPEVAAERVAARMARQSVLMRADLAGWFVISENALRTVVGSHVVIADQAEHLVTVGALRSVTIQVVPAGTAHCGMWGAFTVATGGAYVETAFGGMVFEDAPTLQGLARRFDTIRAQAWSAPESLDVIRRIRDEHRHRVA